MNTRWKTRTRVERRNRERNHWCRPRSRRRRAWRAWVAACDAVLPTIPWFPWCDEEFAKPISIAEVYEIGGASQAAVDAIEDMHTRYIDDPSHDSPPLDCSRRARREDWHHLYPGS